MRVGEAHGSYRSKRPREDQEFGFDALALDDAFCLCLIFYLPVCERGNLHPVFILLQEHHHQVSKIRNPIT